MRALLLVAACAVLASCASVSREECLAGDWQAIGLRDGAAGREGAAQFSRHQGACAKVDVVPDQSAWARGYAEGIARYCTPTVGLEEGLAGRTYRGVCPVATQARFLEGFNIGRAVHDQREVIARIDREISSLNSEAAKLSAQPQPDMGAIANLSAEIGRLELMRMIERSRLMTLERDAARYRAQLAAGG